MSRLLATTNAPTLRADLSLVPAANGLGGHLLCDPATGEVYEFGEAESFLLLGMRRAYTRRDLFSTYAEQFGEALDPSEFEGLLTLLQEWGLLALDPGDGRAGTIGGNRPAANTLPKRPVADRRQVSAPATRSPGPPRPADDSGEGLGSAARPATTAPARARFPNHWRMFAPQPLLDLLLPVCSPLSVLARLLPALAVLCVIAIAFNWRVLLADLLANPYVGGGNIVYHFLFTMVSINLITQITKGLVARSCGLPVPSFGLTLANGMLPRFDLRIDPNAPMSTSILKQLSRSALQIRLALFVLGTTLWLLTRASGTRLPVIGAALGAFSALSFIDFSNPLLNADGYRLLALHLRTPNLRQRANRALFSMFRKRPAAIVRHAGNTTALRAYALASILFLLALVGFVGFNVASQLEAKLQGVGVVIFLTLVAMMTTHILHMRRARRNQASPSVDSAPPPPLLPHQRRGSATTADEPPQGRPRPRRPWGSYVRKTLLLVAAAAVFLPYRYETSGTAEILPISRHELYAETAGILEEVRFNGGEWVQPGEIIAVLSDSSQRKDVLATVGTLATLQENLARLQTTPSREAITLAEQQVSTARLTAQYSVVKKNRIEALFKKGNASQGEFDAARETMEVDEQKRLEKEANLAAVKAQVNPHEITAVMAEQTRSQADLAYYEEQLNRTRLRSRIAGHIVTMNLRDLEKKFLKAGELFAVIEDDRQIKITISVPEADILEVRVGNRVRLKVWALPNQPFTGVVTEIYAAATEKDYGRVVGVISVIDNPGGQLRTGMTGQAKIQGSETIVGWAFTRALVRFAQVEVWSWIP